MYPKYHQNRNKSRSVRPYSLAEELCWGMYPSLRFGTSEKSRLSGRSLLDSMPHAQHAPFVKVLTQHLHANRKAGLGLSAGHADSGNPCQVRGDVEDVRQIHG